MKQRNQPTYYYSLDAIRGVAAIAVLIFHWQHFFYHDGKLLPSFVASEQPLYNVLAGIYSDGWRAVELFFCLSGFIFHWLYSDSINQRKVDIKSFAVLRLSRLYPLHLVTLLVASLGLWIYRAQNGSGFVANQNNAGHFLLQTFFASSWGLESGRSFNIPIWSVSVEVLLYLVFFFLCMIWRPTWRGAVLLVVSGLIVRDRGNPEVGSGLMCFYAGALVYMASRTVTGHPWEKRLVVIGPIALVAAWLLVPWNYSRGFAYRLVVDSGIGEFASWGGRDVVGAVVLQATALSYDLFLFPFTVFTLALMERSSTKSLKFLSPLGEISYGCYLLHFPLQLFVLLGVTGAGLSRKLFYNPLVLIVFLILVIGLSLLSHRYFERPVQDLIRRRFRETMSADSVRKS